MGKPIVRLFRGLALLSLALAVTAGCALVDGKQPVGRMITSWSQGKDDRIVSFAPKGTVVLADDADRQAFLSRLPDKLDASAVRGVDLSANFLVLGSYSKCMDRSRVWMDSGRTQVWFESYVPREDRNTACAWSPVTVDVWLLPRSELRDTPAHRLATGAPK